MYWNIKCHALYPTTFNFTYIQVDNNRPIVVAWSKLFSKSTPIFDYSVMHWMLLNLNLIHIRSGSNFCKWFFYEKRAVPCLNRIPILIKAILLFVQFIECYIRPWDCYILMTFPQSIRVSLYGLLINWSQIAFDTELPIL